MEAPKQLNYGGKCDPKLLNEFFWSPPCYLNAIRVKDDKSKVDITILYFVRMLLYSGGESMVT